MSSEPVTDGLKDVLTVDWDHHDADLVPDPYPTYETLRERNAITWDSAYGGFWVLTDYDSVYRATRDSDLFSSASGVTIPPYPRTLIPIDTDAPQTQQLRHMIHHLLSPPAVAAMEPHIYEIANELVDGFIEKGECDFMDDFALPLPVRVVFPLLGIPEDGWADLSAKMYDLNRWLKTDPERAMAAAMSLNMDVLAHLEDRRVNGLRNDIISNLISGSLDGEPLDDMMILDYVFVVIGGGIFTTVSALGHSLIRMQQQPELREQLLADRSLIPSAIEEFVRIDPPVQIVARTMTRDAEVGGCPMRAGDKTLLVFGAANRDPNVFPDPGDINFDRENNRHLSFGMGLHRCIGSHLGRLMFRVMLETVLERLPDFEVSLDTMEYYDDIGPIRGLHHMRGRFTPGPRLHP